MINEVDLSKDLISKSKLYDEAVRLSGPFTGDGWDNWGVYNLIMRQPPVDAVPVVRCEHCKETIECQLYGEHCGLPPEKGIFCEVWQTVVDKNGYCYQARRKDDANA